MFLIEGSAFNGYKVHTKTGESNFDELWVNNS